MDQLAVHHQPAPDPGPQGEAHRVARARLEARKVTHRPFSLPISLHPKLARALVNLARVPMGGVLLDPFCGTGGILL